MLFVFAWNPGDPTAQAYHRAPHQVEPICSQYYRVWTFVGRRVLDASASYARAEFPLGFVGLNVSNKVDHDIRCVSFDLPMHGSVVRRGIRWQHEIDDTLLIFTAEAIEVAATYIAGRIEDEPAD